MANTSDNGIAYRPFVEVIPAAPRRRTRRYRRRLMRQRLFEVVTICGAVIAIGGAALTSILSMMYPGI